MGVCAWVPHLDVCALCVPASFQRPPCLLCCPSWACARRVCGFVRPSSCVFVFFSATIFVTCRRLVGARAPRPLLFLLWHRLLALPSTQLPLVSAASRPRPPRSARPRLPFHNQPGGAHMPRRAPGRICAAKPAGERLRFDAQKAPALPLGGGTL